jgi:hypothetical protein
MTGKLAIELQRNGEQDFTLSGSVLDAVDVEGSLADGPFALGVAAKDPLWSLHADGVVRTLDVTLDLGEVTLTAPWIDLFKTSLARGTFALDWKGLSAHVALDDGAKTLDVTNIGLGDGTSTIKLDATTLVAIDLNAQTGRRFDLTVSPVAGELPSFAFAPGLSLKAAFHLQPLADAGDTVADYLRDEIYDVTIGRLVQPVAADAVSGFPGGVKVLEDSITIAAERAGASVTAPTGMCLVGDPLTAGEQPIIGLFAVRACP